MARSPVYQQVSTLARSAPEARPDDADVCCLTVLSHPDPGRVGEQAFLTGLASGEERISRLEPQFVSPRGGTPCPLDDPWVSRAPLRVSLLPDGGVRLDPGSGRARITLAGLPLTSPFDVPRAELREGVVLLFGHRVALFLHLVPEPPVERPPAFGLVGESPAVLHLRQEIGRLADLDYAVLLRGESGTGKELVASALHRAGPRKAGRFVCVNAGAIPAALAAAELFGALRGSYTGADKRRSGYFEQADGGTLFLDEIGESPAEVQVLLLRALETGKVLPVGAADPVAVDVRLVSATDADLASAMAVGEFRGPLYHRLAAYELELPPLRARRDDLGRLFFHFLRLELERLGEAERLEPRPVDADPWVPAELVARLAAYSWPGNVRQLHNVVRHLVVASRGAAELRVPAAVERLLVTPPVPEPSDTAGELGPSPKYRDPEEVSEAELLSALRTHRWKIQATADALEVSRPSLYRLMDECPRVRKAGDLDVEEIRRARETCEGRLDAMVDVLKVSKRGLKLRMTELGL